MSGYRAGAAAGEGGGRPGGGDTVDESNHIVIVRGVLPQLLAHRDCVK